MKLLHLLPVVAIALLAAAPRTASAHCDTLDGPVVKDARAALEAKDVTPVLKWVKADREPEIREAFAHAVAVRALGPEPRALADRFFFETLVRVHRAGEGAPYTGLKPAGTPVDPGIAAADVALESGRVETLVGLVTRDVERGLRERHARAVAARPHAGESVEKGREYVEVYVEFVHYVERVVAAVAGGPGEAGEHAH
jgi:hypothetical protein